MIATKTIPDFSLSPHVDQVGIEERAARFTKRSIKNETKINGLKLALNMIDLTTLEGKDTDGKVKQLCYKALHLHDAYPGLANSCSNLCLSVDGKNCQNSIGRFR